jgi:zinc-ribbon domain
MDLGALFLLLALALLVGVIISRPLFFKGTEEPAVSASLPAEHQRSTLLAERDRLLTALQELEFDHNLGKVPEEDYPEQRAGLVKSTAEVLRQLDTVPAGSALAGEPAASQETTPQPALAEDGFSSIIFQRKNHEDLEALIAAHRRARPLDGKAVGFCSKCGKPATRSDKFCSRCGTAL